jgi:starvation-inducible DNA-binding protein
MAKTNLIGLDAGKAEQLGAQLNQLLADFQIFYINARGFHWNINGPHFFELHQKFEELYTDAMMRIDEIAERIVTLGHRPMHTYTDYLNNARVKEQPNVSDAQQAVRAVLEAFSHFIAAERSIGKLADEAGDEGTSALMSDYLRAQEKQVWMYSAFLAE